MYTIIRTKSGGKLEIRTRAPRLIKHNGIFMTATEFQRVNR